MNIIRSNNNINSQKNHLDYCTMPKEYINNIIKRIVQCMPILIALAMVSALALLIPQAEGHPIVPMPSTTIKPAGKDDVQIIPLFKTECTIIPSENLRSVPIVKCRAVENTRYSCNIL